MKLSRIQNVKEREDGERNYHELRSELMAKCTEVSEGLIANIQRFAAEVDDRFDGVSSGSIKRDAENIALMETFLFSEKTVSIRPFHTCSYHPAPYPRSVLLLCILAPTITPDTSLCILPPTLASDTSPYILAPILASDTSPLVASRPVCRLIRCATPRS